MQDSVSAKMERELRDIFYCHLGDKIIASIKLARFRSITSMKLSWANISYVRDQSESKAKRTNKATKGTDAQGSKMHVTENCDDDEDKELSY